MVTFTFNKPLAQLFLLLGDPKSYSETEVLDGRVWAVASSSLGLVAVGAIAADPPERLYLQRESLTFRRKSAQIVAEPHPYPTGSYGHLKAFWNLEDPQGAKEISFAPTATKAINLMTQACDLTRWEFRGPHGGLQIEGCLNIEPFHAVRMIVMPRGL
jgi:hypothetical protein